jgi:hypothetical protein
MICKAINFCFFSDWSSIVQKKFFCLCIIELRRLLLIQFCGGKSNFCNSSGNCQRAFLTSSGRSVVLRESQTSALFDQLLALINPVSDLLIFAMII